MNKKNEVIMLNNIQSKIYTIRGLQVMIDRDLAKLYDVETKVLNQAVKRNIERFPEKFRFQLSKQEKDKLVANFDRFDIYDDTNSNLKSQIVTSSSHGGRRTLPYAFTEQGVSMLSAVLRSKTAIRISIQIMDAFVNMRKFITNNANIFHRLITIEQKQYLTDTKLDKVLEAIELREIVPKQGIFYDGQIFDAYKLLSDIIRTAKKSIIVIDNYINDTTLQLFSKRKSGVKVKLYTKIISKSLQQDLIKYNSQYEKIEIQKLQTSHDRFMIIDNKTVYHFGASLKDLGKKWFAFSKLEIDANDLIEKLGTD